jgi:hypothetical protein
MNVSVFAAAAAESEAPCRYHGQHTDHGEHILLFHSYFSLSFENKFL